MGRRNGPLPLECDFRQVTRRRGIRRQIEHHASRRLYLPQLFYQLALRFQPGATVSDIFGI